VSTRTPTLLLLIALAMGAAVPAGATVLCRTRAGAIHVRAACTRREHVVELVQGPKGATGDRGPSTPAPHVVDAAGKPVGVVAEMPGFKGRTMVVVPVGNRFVHIPLDSVNERWIYFVSADCTGPRYALQQANTLFRNATIFGGTAYYAEDPIVSVMTASFLYEDTPSRCMSSGNTPVAEGCCQMQNDYNEKGPLTVAFPMSALGTPPFNVEF